MRMWRERAGLSQYELADLSGVTQKTIWALEHDKNNGSVTTVETSCRCTRPEHR